MECTDEHDVTHIDLALIKLSKNQAEIEIFARGTHNLVACCW
jgi:hypothetical protein